MPSGRVLSCLVTASSVGSSTQFKRRRTVSGRTTRPYSDCLKLPRNISAMLQMKPMLSLKLFTNVNPTDWWMVLILIQRHEIPKDTPDVSKWQEKIVRRY